MFRMALVVALLVGCGDSQKSCDTAASCPGDATCTAITCDSHVCHYTDYLNQSSSPVNEAGDCKQILCDGFGGGLVSIDMTDKPATSGPCQLGQCAQDGTPSTGQAPVGTMCGARLFCDSA